ncbi:MAG TPA: DUF5666 domain-containing protein [Vicinamibacterales bacterium]|nr:DUF5666 domain-containing protein [Vicinamibacterales bacterium]
MSKTWIVGVALMAALAIPAVSRAHEGHAHKVMGTVSTLSEKQFEVKTTDGKTVTIALDAKTVYRHGKAKADAKMLKVGERVVVEAEQAQGATVMTAKTVQMAATTSPAAEPAATHAH